MKQILLASLPCATTGQPQVGRFELQGESWMLIGVSRQRPGSTFQSEAAAGPSRLVPASPPAMRDVPVAVCANSRNAATVHRWHALSHPGVFCAARLAGAGLGLKGSSLGFPRLVTAERPI